MNRKKPLCRFYVYKHTDPESESILYVGKGTQSRAWEMQDRSHEHKHWISSVDDKYHMGDIVSIVQVGMTESEAFVLESTLIKDLKPVFNKLGQLGQYDAGRALRRKILALASNRLSERAIADKLKIPLPHVKRVTKTRKPRSVGWTKEEMQEMDRKGIKYVV